MMTLGRAQGFDNDKNPLPPKIDVETNEYVI
jgi:hypothetical protein